MHHTSHGLSFHLHLTHNSDMTDALHSVRRASDRAAANAHQDFKRGVDSLASIAATAPLFGFLGTVELIVHSIPGMGEKWALQAFILTNLPQSVWPMALGLVIATAAFWIRYYLTTRLDALDREMERGTHALLDHLQTNWL